MLWLLPTVALLLSGCRADDGEQARQPPPTEAGGPSPSPKLDAEQVLRLNTFFQPPSFDPGRSPGNFGPNALIRQYSEPLLKLAPRGEGIRGASAESYEVSPDGLTYTFRLREDGRYNDGKLVTAHDFVYAWRRLVDPRLAAVQGSTFARAVEGGQQAAAHDPKGDPAAIEASLDRLGLSAPNERTFQVRLARPDPNFEALATLSAVAPVRRDVVEQFGEQWATKPDTLITNGPFKVAEVIPGQSVKLVPNPHYRDKPILEELSAVHLRGEQIAAAWAMYLNDEQDISNGPPTASLEAALNDPRLQDEFISFPEPAVNYLVFNTTKPPLTNPAVRQALARAIDRHAYVEGVLHGLGLPTNTLVPTDVPGHRPDLGEPQEFDPEAAKRVLSASGVNTAELSGLKLLVPPFNTPAAEFIADQFKRHLGVEMTIDPSEEAYTRPAEGRYDLCVCGFVQAAYPDPHPLFEVFQTTNPQNTTKWSNPEYDRLVEEAASAVDSDKRLALYHDAHALLVSEAPAAFLYQQQRFFWVKPWVKGIVRTPYDDADFPGSLYATEIYIEEH